MSRRHNDLTATAELAGILAGLSGAARHTGNGMQIAGSRIGRRAGRAASESAYRFGGAYRALRGDRPARRGLLAIVAVAVVAGAAGAVSALGVRRIVVSRRERTSPLAEPAEAVTESAKAVTESAESAAESAKAATGRAAESVVEAQAGMIRPAKTGAATGG